MFLIEHYVAMIWDVSSRFDDVQNKAKSSGDKHESHRSAEGDKFLNTLNNVKVNVPMYTVKDCR